MLKSLNMDAIVDLIKGLWRHYKAQKKALFIVIFVVESLLFQAAK